MQLVIRRLPIIGSALLLASALGLAQAAAAAPVTRTFVIEVPPAQDHAFNVGMKAYEKCLRAHGDRHATYAYDAETGDLSRYLLVSEYSDWGGMDAHNPADKPCMTAFRTEVLPHVSQAFSDIAVLNAKESYPQAADPDPAPMMWVDAYRIKVGEAPAFHEALAKYAAAAEKIHWEAHFAAYDIEGAGQGGANFVLVAPQKSWADAGQDARPSAKDMMYSVYGKAAADAGHQKFLDAIAESWSEVWSYDKDLSLIPAK